MTATPDTGLCLICATEYALTAIGAVPALPEHVFVDKTCIGSGAPPSTDHGPVDDMRRFALGHAHTATIAARRHREQIAALAADGSHYDLIMERVTAMIEAEVLASRWTSSTFETTLVAPVISAVGFLASAYVPIDSADAFMDARFRAATRTWLREVHDDVPGSILGDLLRLI